MFLVWSEQACTTTGGTEQGFWKKAEREIEKAIHGVLWLKFNHMFFHVITRTRDMIPYLSSVYAL